MDVRRRQHHCMAPFLTPNYADGPLIAMRGGGFHLSLSLSLFSPREGGGASFSLQSTRLREGYGWSHARPYSSVCGHNMEYCTSGLRWPAGSPGAIYGSVPTTPFLLSFYWILLRAQASETLKQQMELCALNAFI